MASLDDAVCFITRRSTQMRRVESSEVSLEEEVEGREYQSGFARRRRGRPPPRPLLLPPLALPLPQCHASVFYGSSKVPDSRRHSHTSPGGLPGRRELWGWQ